MRAVHRIVAVAIALTAAVGPGPAGAQPAADVLELHEAIALALRNSHRLGVADARVEAADADTDAARSRRLPRVVLAQTFLYTTNPVAVFGSLLEQERFGEANFAVPRLNEPDPLTHFETGARVEQPLWTGGRIAGAIDAAELRRQAADASRDRERQRVVHGVVEAYSGAILAAYQLDVARQARETADAHVDLVRDLREAGLVLESDLLQARVRASEVEELVIRAESGIAVAEAALNLSMGLPLDRPVTLPRAAGFLDDAAVPAALQELLTTAAGARPDLRAARRQAEAAGRMVDVARADRLPTVGVGGSWEMSHPDRPGASGTNWTLSAMARWSVFDGSETGARIAAARARHSEARRQHDLLADAIGLEVRRAWHELRAATQRVQEAALAVSMAEASLGTVEDRYREGLTTLVELLDAQTALTRARVRDVAARRDVLLARADLDLAVGRDAGTAPAGTDEHERSGDDR